MNKFLPKTTFFFFLFITAITVFWLPAQADEPTAVHLASFDVVPLNNAVRIEWQTASELDTAGYRIKRATSGGSEEYLDNIGDSGFIAGTGGAAFGGTYSATDNEVNNGEVYTYILIEVEKSGAEAELARETVTVGIPPTNTPVVISSGTGSNTAATATTTSGSTRTASATPNIQATTSTTTDPTKASSSFVTITPRSVQPAASPTQNASTTTDTRQNINTNTESSSTDTEDHYEELTGSTITGITEVFAQEDLGDETETEEFPPQQTDFETDLQTQGDYPGGTPTPVATAVPNTYPNDTPVPIIGSNQDYTGPSADTAPNTTNPGKTSSTSQGNLFLWVGFIVALLIFTTGLIGSIVLFTRKSN